MTKRISELPNVSTTTNDDLLELAQVDLNSPTGYSSRSIRVGDLPISGDGIPCRYIMEEQVEFFGIDDGYGLAGVYFSIYLPIHEINQCCLGDDIISNDDPYAGSANISLSIMIANLPGNPVDNLIPFTVQSVVSQGNMSAFSNAASWYRNFVIVPYGIEDASLASDGIEFMFRINQNFNTHSWQDILDTVGNVRYTIDHNFVASIS